MSNEILPLLALLFVTFGVGLSLIKGIGNRPGNEPIKLGRIASSLIIGVLGVVATVNLTTVYVAQQLNELGIVAFAVLYLLQGFATDQGLSRLDK